MSLCSGDMKREATRNYFRRGAGLRGGLGASGRHREESQAAGYLELGTGVTLGGHGPRTFPGPLPGGCEGLLESATLAGVHRGVAQ